MTGLLLLCVWTRGAWSGFCVCGEDDCVGSHEAAFVLHVVGAGRAVCLLLFLNNLSRAEVGARE